jgi:hypothetical protein
VENFILYGGTGLALQLGHRQSEDFDFFAFEDIDPEGLCESVPYLQGARILRRAPNTLTCLVERDGPVQLSFFGLPRLRSLEEARQAADIGLRVASLTDLAATKMRVVQQRASVKDYTDVYALIRMGKLTLRQQLRAAERLYGRTFAPSATLKALAHFEDGDLPQLDGEVKMWLRRAVKRAGIPGLPPKRAAEDGRD